MVVHVLKQTASRFEANFHVRGTDFQLSNHYWFNRGEKNYYLIDTGTIISWALLSLLNNIYLVTRYMYVSKRDYTRGVYYVKAI